MNYLFINTNCVFQSCNTVYHGFQEASKSSNVIFLNVFITLPYHINCNLTFYHYVQNELLLRQTFYILPKRNYAFPAIHAHIHYIIYVTSNYIILETFQTKKVLGIEIIIYI